MIDLDRKQYLSTTIINKMCVFEFKNSIRREEHVWQNQQTWPRVTKPGSFFYSLCKNAYVLADTENRFIVKY